jgi:predicted transposase YdaD
LFTVIDNYLTLSEEEEEEMRRILEEDPEMEEVIWSLNPWVQKGRAEGREEGREEGITEGKRDVLLRMMSWKLGDLPASVAQKLESMEDDAELDEIARRILTATSLEEMGLLQN